MIRQTGVLTVCCAYVVLCTWTFVYRAFCDVDDFIIFEGLEDVTPDELTLCEGDMFSTDELVSLLSSNDSQ
jgi:hypothetical protein